MNKQYDLDFIKKELKYLKKEEGRNWSGYLEKYNYKYGGYSWKGKHSVTFAEFLAKNENNAFFYFQTRESQVNSLKRVEMSLLFPEFFKSKEYYPDSEKKEKLKVEIERLVDPKDKYDPNHKIKKWIKNLGKTNCDYNEKCESKWISTEDFQEQIYNQELDFEELNKKYEQFDLLRPENEMDEITKKALVEYDQEAEKIISRYDVDIYQDYVESIKNNKWMKIHNFGDFFEGAKYAKDDKDCLAQILLKNTKIRVDGIDTSYSAFSRLEPLSNYNLVDSLIQKHWKDYPDFFEEEENSNQFGFDKFVADIKSGKIVSKETELLGYTKVQKMDERLEEKNSEVKTKSTKLKMKM